MTYYAESQMRLLLPFVKMVSVNMNASHEVDWLSGLEAANKKLKTAYLTLMFIV